MSTIEVLRAARELISDPARWTQNANARDEDGAPCEIEDGASWCALGAIDKFSGKSGAPAKALLAASGWYTVTSYNDAHTHAEVLALFDRAIAAEAAP